MSVTGSPRRLHALLLHARRGRERDVTERDRPRVWLLDRHPEQRAILDADPEWCTTTAVEEIVRYASPVMHMRRNVAHDTELAGRSARGR